MSYLEEAVQNKWRPVLEHEDLAPIKDPHRRAVTAQILENTETSIRETRAAMSGSYLNEAAPTNATGCSAVCASHHAKKSARRVCTMGM